MAAPSLDESSPSASSFSVRILSQLPAPTDADFTLGNIKLETTVEELKLRIQDHLSSHPPPPAQRLIYQGRHMNIPAQTIQDICGSQASEYVHTFHLVVQQSSQTHVTIQPGLVRPVPIATQVPDLITPSIAQPTDTHIHHGADHGQTPELNGVSSIVDNMHRMAQTAGAARDNQPHQAFLLTDPTGQNRGIVHSGQVLGHGHPPPFPAPVGGNLQFGSAPFPFPSFMPQLTGAQIPHLPPSPLATVHHEHDPARRVILADEVASASRALSQMNLRLAEANEAYAQAMRSLAVVNSMAGVPRDRSDRAPDLSGTQQNAATQNSLDREALLDRFRGDRSPGSSSATEQSAARHRVRLGGTSSSGQRARTPPREQPEQARAQVELPLQDQEAPAAQENANLEQLIAGPVGQLWLAFRIGLFIYFFAGGASWARLVLFTLVGIAYWLSQSPYFGPLRNRLQAHFEALVGPRDVRPPVNAQQNQGAGQRMPTEQQTATRLLNARRERDNTWARERLRVFERAIALFLVSLWPGENADNLRRRLDNQEAAQQPNAVLQNHPAVPEPANVAEGSAGADSSTPATSSQTEAVATDSAGQGSSTGVEAASGEGLTRRHEGND